MPFRGGHRVMPPSSDEMHDVSDSRRMFLKWSAYGLGATVLPTRLLAGTGT